ncbi:DsbE family thiol:disulfide interchange protein [Tepidicaulis sp. LMO-SS28]|uniref:DsbE family thiol:disulfide interchange protein n=1 Tax=Tepidicaulis sp. LMO-SS28 TaxID=3447455 RepID=UPI003EE2B2B4
MRWTALLPLGFFAALAAVFYVSIFAGDPSEVPSALIGKGVPDFALPPIEGMESMEETGGFSDEMLKNGEVTVVNVWASWCVPCRAEHPLLEQVSGAGVRLAGINYKDPPEAARRFLGQLGNPFDLIGADRRGRAAIDWGVYGVPETFVVDGEGTIIHKHVGPLAPEDIGPLIERARQASR